MSTYNRHLKKDSVHNRKYIQEYLRINIQETQLISNKIRHIHEIGYKIINLIPAPPTPDHVGVVVRIPLHVEWYD